MAQTNTNANTGTNNGATPNGNAKREAKAPTAVDAINKITKVLDLLTPSDRKRTLAFVNASYNSETGESNA